MYLSLFIKYIYIYYYHVNTVNIEGQTEGSKEAHLLAD